MTRWTSTDQALFSTIAKMKQSTLLRSMNTFLKKYYNSDKISTTEDYILCEGNVPIMLVAHMDTVFKAPPQKIYYDHKQHTMWSPEGLGADDRAGVYLIWKIVQMGYKPHICLTTNEEVGGIGASNLAKRIPECPFDLKYIVELDRQGVNDCVFYSCANEKFVEFVENYGFITEWGTFTDISEICPAWKIAGVNLSVGYVNEHHFTETLNTRAMNSTLKKVCKMIDEIDSAPYFEYITDPYEKYYYGLGKKYMTAYGWDDFPEDDDWTWAASQKRMGYYPITSNPKLATRKCQCCKCHKFFNEDDVFPVKSKKYEGEVKFYCLDCVSTDINWCKNCGEPFEIENDNEELCPDCSGKKREKLVIV